MFYIIWLYAVAIQFLGFNLLFEPFYHIVKPAYFSRCKSRRLKQLGNVSEFFDIFVYVSVSYIYVIIKVEVLAVWIIVTIDAHSGLDYAVVEMRVINLFHLVTPFIHLAPRAFAVDPKEFLVGVQLVVGYSSSTTYII